MQNLNKLNEIKRRAESHGHRLTDTVFGVKREDDIEFHYDVDGKPFVSYHPNANSGILDEIERLKQFKRIR